MGQRRGPLPAGGRQSRGSMTEPLQFSFRVGASPERAFELWTAQTSTWWPASHTVSGQSGRRGRHRAARRRPHLRANPGGCRARLGRGHRVGAAEADLLPLASAAGPRRRDRGRGHLRAGRRFGREHQRVDRASGVGAPWRRGFGGTRTQPAGLGGTAAPLSGRRGMRSRPPGGPTSLSGPLDGERAGQLHHWR